MEDIPEGLSRGAIGQIYHLNQTVLATVWKRHRGGTKATLAVRMWKGNSRDT